MVRLCALYGCDEPQLRSARIGRTSLDANAPEEEPKRNEAGAARAVLALLPCGRGLSTSIRSFLCELSRRCFGIDRDLVNGHVDCVAEGIVGGDEGPVSGVAQVVCHGVKVVGAHGEVGREEDGEVQGEVKGEVEQLREKRSSWMVWRWGDRLKKLEPMWSVMNDQTRNTKDSVQVCSILHVAHVDVRRVTLVIVHNGHQDVFVVIHTFA